MTPEFPASFADKKTGAIKRLEKPLKKFIGDFVPSALQYGFLAAQALFLAPLVGGPLVAIPTVLLLAHLENNFKKKIQLRAISETLDGTATRYLYDPNTPGDSARFNQNYPGLHPNLLNDCAAIARDAGLTRAPVIVIQTDSEERRSISIGRTSKNGDHAIFIGVDNFKGMSQQELRGVIAHEVTHACSGDTALPYNKQVSWLGHALIVVSIVTSLVAGAGAVISAAAPGICSLANIAYLTLGSLASRYRERRCDRGAAILTGETESLAQGLVNPVYAPDGAPKKVSAIAHFIGASHPRDHKRAEWLRRFERKYPTFCENRRKLFDAFNAAARPPTANGNKPQTGVQNGPTPPKSANGNTP